MIESWGPKEYAATVGLGLLVWKGAARWGRLETRVDLLWDARMAQGRMKLKKRRALKENSPLSLGDAVREAMQHGIADDMLVFFRERSNRRLPSHDADVWNEVVRQFGMTRLRKRAEELEWDMDEYITWWVEGLRNPSIVEEALKR